MENKNMKKVFVAFTEQGRVKGKVSGAILKLENKFKHCTELKFPSKSNKGISAEVISMLVKVKELPKEALDDSGYPNYEIVNEIAEIVIIESQGLAYFTKI